MAAWPALRNAIGAIADWAPWPIGMTVIIGLACAAAMLRLVWVVIGRIAILGQQDGAGPSGGNRQERHRRPATRASQVSSATSAG